tara:strand:- start:280 stop:552 length:273 start_codon:yes stop_codon:yes gene_type:complete
MNREEFLEIKIDMLEKELKLQDKWGSHSFKKHKDLINRLMNGEKVSDYEMIMELHSVKFNDWLDEEHEKFQNDWEKARIKYYKAKELLEE